MDAAGLLFALAILPYLALQYGFSIALLVGAAYAFVWGYKAWLNAPVCGFWFPTMIGVGPDGAFSVHWPSYGFSTVVFCGLVVFAVIYAVDAQAEWIMFVWAAVLCGRLTFTPMLMSHAWAAAHTKQNES